MRACSAYRYLNTFHNFERTASSGNPLSWNLPRMKKLLQIAGRPDKNYFSVLIAGTKGKGTTGFFLESILLASGISTGFYSSPHLEDPRERIRIDGKSVSRKDWGWGLGRIQKLLWQHPVAQHLGAVTYFEVMTLLAALVFQKRGCEIALLEVGMGGRFDATNAFPAKLEILTPVHLDHEEYLGHTIAKIAQEKAAVIKPRSQVVMAPQKKEALNIVCKQCARVRAELSQVRLKWTAPIGLQGEHQRANAAVAVRAARVLARAFRFPVLFHQIPQALLKTGWPARLELFSGKKEVLLDAAHNPVSVKALVRFLQTERRLKEIIFVFGVSKDKNSEKMLKELSGISKRIILVKLPTPRTAELSALIFQARKFFQEIYPAATIPEAMKTAFELCRPGARIVVTGSFYLAGDVRRILRKSSCGV